MRPDFSSLLDYRISLVLFYFCGLAKCRATDFLRKHFWQSVRDFLRKDFGQVYGITLKCHSKNNVAILTFENMNIWRIIGSPKNFVIN